MLNKRFRPAFEFSTQKRAGKPISVMGISALLCGVFLFTGANSLLTTLVVLEANDLGMSQSTIGILTSGYFAGFVLGCIYGGDVVARVGHIRTFAGFASIATICALSYPIAPIALIWIMLRAFGGFSHAILQMSVESWLTTAGSQENRSSLISVYRITDLASVTLAQFALLIKGNEPFFLFAIIAISISLSLTPIVFSRATGPTSISSSKPAVFTLVKIAPMAAAGSLVVGLVSSGFWGLSPIFLTNAGYGPDIVALFISSVIIGGALFQWPVGKASDKIDRRLVIMGASVVAACASILLVIVQSHLVAVLVTGALFGGAVLPIYALAVSHAGDANEETEKFVSVAGAVLLFFGAGAVIGPAAFSLIMQNFGDSALFFSMTAVLIALFGFGVWRRSEQAPRVNDMKEDFVIVTRSTPEVFEMDPRSSEPDIGSHPVNQT